MKHSPPVIVRIPPSPTGPMHLGTARTALFNYLFAKQHGGKFILRIEDTDRERSKKEFEDNILDGLKWLGLDYDEFYRQSERTDIHKKYLKQLLEGGNAYLSKEEIKKAGDRAEVIRFKNPGQNLTFNDLIRGEITFNTKELGDFVIAKDLETPLYHLAVVADDIAMGVTHVIRGEDHISNTPRQILLIEALGAKRPIYAHIPLILAPDKSKLSKRHGAVAVTEYREEGYLPEALINFMALLGWSPQATVGGSGGTDQEIFSLAELVKLFDLAAVQKGSAIFNVEKLNWLNREYLKKIKPREALEKIKEFIPERLRSVANDKILARLAPTLIDRIHTFHEVAHLAAAEELDYFFSRPEYPKELLRNQKPLATIIKLLEPLPAGEFSALAVKEAVWEYATKEGRGEVLWPMRAALAGREKSPDPFSIASILGKEETLARLTYARDL